MTHKPHSLAADFPDQVGKISALKENDGHFARLAQEYEALNLRVARAEARLDTISEEDEEHLRRARVMLKDQIWARLR